MRGHQLQRAGTLESPPDAGCSEMERTLGLQVTLYSSEKVQAGEWFQWILGLFRFLHAVILHAQIV